MALTLLDPAKATEAAQTLRINAMAVDFQALIDDPNLVDNATFDQATTDAIAICHQALRSGAALARARHPVDPRS